jgi:pSer/pThr/pTyr-binding forkhead associated (FHA) protein
MERSATEFPVLIAQKGPLDGQRWAISKVFTVGREPGCDLTIPDRQVSRYHARFTPGKTGVMVEDLGSKNGTFCNGSRIEDSVYLQDGDIVQVALVQNFVYLSSDATMPLDTSAPVLQGKVGRLFLDSLSRRVWIHQQEVLPPLSVPQFRLLQMLYEQQGRVVARQSLVETVWVEDAAMGVSEEALDALVRRLRDRLAILDPKHTYIVTVRGHGLRLDNPPA